MNDDPQVNYCVYCDAQVSSLDYCVYCDAQVSSLDVPAVDDDDAWEKIAREHEDHCEWVLTRAHRIDAPAEDDR